MTEDDFSMTFEAFNAQIVKDTIAVTAPAGETPADRLNRTRAIVVMFQGLDPATPVQAMIVGQIVATRYALMAALRDLNNPEADLKTLTRMRAVTMAMSKTLDSWFARLAALKAQEAETLPEPVKAARPQPARTAPQAEIPRPVFLNKAPATGNGHAPPA